MKSYSFEEILKEKGYTDEDVSFCQLFLSTLETSGQRLGHDKIAELLGVVHFWYLMVLYKHGFIGLTEHDGDPERNVLGYVSRLAQNVMEETKNQKKEKI
jgi:hypothetical protein